jgi:5-methyltetrahydropteroyltriglutamate--homocysteine methyltransferase
MTSALSEPLSTQIVGSYSKPHWLLSEKHAQRVQRYDPESYWVPRPEVRDEAIQDAVRLSIYEQERAGLRVVTDGEQWRHTYDTSFIMRMSGVDLDRWSELTTVTVELGSSFERIPVTAEEAEENRRGPTLVAEPHMANTATSDEVKFAKRVAQRPLKVTAVGPFTASERIANRFYDRDDEFAFGVARALNEELRALEKAGVDMLQLDEPLLNKRLSKARGYRACCEMKAPSSPVGRGHGSGPAPGPGWGEMAISAGKVAACWCGQRHPNLFCNRLYITEALNIAVSGISVPTVVHVCYGFPNYIVNVDPSDAYEQCLRLVVASDVAAISLAYEYPHHEPDLLAACGDKHVIPGMLNLTSDQVESVDCLGDRIHKALAVVPADRLHPSVDCGMWFMPRELPFSKLSALAAAADTVRGKL